MFNEEELTLNGYRMYQKTYSKWSIACQSIYTTRKVAEMAKIFDDLQQHLYIKYTLSIAIYVVGFFFFMAFLLIKAYI